MMLTESTAASVGVKNRLDPSESIAGGGAYFARVVQMLPAHILEPDRTWFALAAYNVGFGHVEDARILAQSQGRDPDAWSDVSKSLPLLAEERWYTQAKRGYARGWEPVNFVSQVRDFLAVLEWASTDAGGELLSPVVVTAPRKKALK
jgi:membrane-bound lytic murein transglycosylase F